MRPIDELNHNVAAARKALIDAERELHDALVASSGVSIGEIVRTERYGDIKVTEIIPWSVGDAWVRGLKKNKDNKFGRRVVSAYSGWKRKTPGPATGGE